MPEPITCGCRRGAPYHTLPSTGRPNPSAWTPQTLQEHVGPGKSRAGLTPCPAGHPQRGREPQAESPEGG